MDHNQLLLLHRTIDLAEIDFQKPSIQPSIGWLVVADNEIILEKWCQSEEEFKLQIRTYLSEWENLSEVSLFLSSSPFQKTEQLQQFCTHYFLKNFFLASEADSSLRQRERLVNRRWYTYHQEKRPYIILKWAQTSDGFIARSNYDSKWISSPLARKLVHQWRAQETAIWVGKNTYRYDNPRLNVRDWVGDNPTRVVLDPDHSLTEQLNVFDQSQPTLYYTTQVATNSSNLTFVTLPDKRDWKSLIFFMFDDLYQKEITSIFVEGGSQLLSFLIEHHWWDEARVFTSETTFEEGINAPSIDKDLIISRRMVGSDWLTTYFRN